jgi:hypothetical protein
MLPNRAQLERTPVIDADLQHDETILPEMLARLKSGDLLKKAEANLPKPSVVNVSQILTVDKSELRECTVKLSRTAVDAARGGRHLLFDRL